MTPRTTAHMALFTNSRTHEWADISIVLSGSKNLRNQPTTISRGYVEFITRCSEDLRMNARAAREACATSAT